MRLTILFAVAVVGAVRTASACSCVPPQPVKVELKRADAVFQGTVVSIDPIASPDASTSGDGRLAVTFDVARVWKGDISKRFILNSVSPHVGMCELDFAVGDRWVIYANGRDGQMYSGLCTRSHRVDGKKPSPDLRALGVGKRAKPVETP